MPSIELDISSQDVTVDGKAITTKRPSHIPHTLVVAATLERGYIRIKALDAKLKHLKDNEYELTFE